MLGAVEWSPARLARYAAAIAAFGLAALYTVGAFLETTELRGAHLDAKTVLPLIPIEQLLARGIATVVLSAPLAASLVGGYALGRTLARTTSTAARQWPAPGYFVLYSVAIFAGFVASQIVFHRTDPVITACLAGLVVTFIGVWRRWRYARLGLFAFVAAILTLAGFAWFSPNPLPRVNVHTSDGERESGTLVAVANGT